MIDHFFPNPVVLVRLRAGPLGAYIDAFAQELSGRGYAVWTMRYAMRLLAALGTLRIPREGDHSFRLIVTAHSGRW
jgi:hypothetical protein